MAPTTHWAAVDPDDIAALYGGDCEPAWPAEPVRETDTLPDISEYQETDIDDDQVDVPAEQRTIPADYLSEERIDVGALIPGYQELLDEMET